MTTDRRLMSMLGRHPLFPAYLLMGLAACIVIMLTLSSRGAGGWGMLATVVGVAGLIFRFSVAPIFVVLGVAVAIMASRVAFLASSPTSDVILAAAVLTYCMAHFRLIGLTRSLRPIDPRGELAPAQMPIQRMHWFVELLFAMTIVPYIIYARRRQGPIVQPPAAPSPRNPALAESDEWPWALAVVGVIVAAVLLLWRFATTVDAPFGIVREQWRLGLLVGLVVVATIVARVAIDYLAGRAMTPTKARLVLNEILWRETRGEERRICRGIARVRADRSSQPRKEGEP